MTLLERSGTSRLYLVDYQNATVLQRITIDQTNHIALIKSEAGELKTGVVREK